MKSNQLTHAIITDAMVYYSLPDGAKQKLYTVEHNLITGGVEDIAKLAIEHNFHTIWVCPGCQLNQWNRDQLERGQSGEWDLMAAFTKNPNKGQLDLLKGVTARKKEGTWKEKRQVTITWPQYTALQWSKRAVDCEDPITCLAAIHYSEKALTAALNKEVNRVVQFNANPGITGRSIIIDTNSLFSRPKWIEKTEFDHSTLPDELGFDASYIRTLDPVNMPVMSGLILLVVDKNSAHIAAGTSTEMGIGEPKHLLIGDIQNEPPETFKKPGYWRLHFHQGDAESLKICPLYRNYKGVISQKWVTTPLLKLLDKMGMPYEIEEGIVWEGKRVLDKLCRVLWAAREDLKTNDKDYPHNLGRLLAYYSIKRIATATIGLLANPQAGKYKPQWARKHWWSTVVESAKARELEQVLDAEDKFGVLPMAIVADALYYLVKPAVAKKMIETVFSKQGLGGWKIVGQLPATYEILKIFSPGQTPGGAAKMVRQVLKERG